MKSQWKYVYRTQKVIEFFFLKTKQLEISFLGSTNSTGNYNSAEKIAKNKLWSFGCDSAKFEFKLLTQFFCFIHAKSLMLKFVV